MQMAEILKGAPVAAALTDELAARCAALKARGIAPALAIIRVGERADDVAYERGAIKRCEKVGIAVKQYLLPADTKQDELLRAIDGINADEGIHGCLMFRPLPRHLDEREICEALDVSKDVDCMTERSLAGVFTGSGRGFAPCTAQSVMELLRHYGINPARKRAVVVGRSLVIGRPVAMLLLAANATVTVCHSRTNRLEEFTRGADIVVAALGRARALDEDYFEPGQIVIDVGINDAGDGTLVGDVDFDSVEPLVDAITPVPAGVGSVTTSVLCAHVIEAAERR